jgi:hypothetical protein
LSFQAPQLLPLRYSINTKTRFDHHPFCRSARLFIASMTQLNDSSQSPHSPFADPSRRRQSPKYQASAIRGSSGTRTVSNSPGKLCRSLTYRRHHARLNFEEYSSLNTGRKTVSPSAKMLKSHSATTYSEQMPVVGRKLSQFEHFCNGGADLGWKILFGLLSWRRSNCDSFCR